jgi:hypothetical protein
MTRTVTPLVSLGLAVLTVALILVGLPVTVAPGSTDRLFSWTIDVPLTTAFLGACYWTAALFTFMAVRERAWVRVRAVMPGILVAGTLILLATLIHLDAFAMEAWRGWIWLILYAGLPPGVVLLLALQRRQHGTDPPVQHPIERWATTALALGATALLSVATALSVFPADTADWWPWPLTELTARMIGAWLAAIGATLVAVVLERDWTRVTPAMIYLAAVAAALLATLARHPGSVEWGTAAAWLYVVLDAALLGLAVHGIRMRPERAHAGVTAAAHRSPPTVRGTSPRASSRRR